jgi:hypothetical protein
MKTVEVIFGPYQKGVLVLSDDNAARAIGEMWARDMYDPDYPQVRDWTLTEVADATEAARVAQGQWLGIIEIPPPVLSAIDPATAVVGDPQLTLTASGSDFTYSSRIVFDGAEKATNFVSDSELTSTIMPAGAVAGTVPVLVRTNGQDSSSLDFTFTDPVG